MPERKLCPYGFDCAGMMLVAGLTAQNCENLEECKSLVRAEGIPFDALEQPTFTIVQYRLERHAEWEQRQQELEEHLERVRVEYLITQHQAAVMMLQRRGNSQEFADFELRESISGVREFANDIEKSLSALANNAQMYIAPPECETHVYNVKRPPRNHFPDDWTLEQVRQNQRIYWYHKLLADTKQFQGAAPDKDGVIHPCRVIHLSHSDDARNIQARLGVARRNQLSKIRTKLIEAQNLLWEASQIAQERYRYDDILAESEDAEFGADE